MARDNGLAAWLARLESLHPRAIDLGLDRVAFVAERLGLDPRCPVIVVGGTNGKGSTCAFLEAILTAAGHRVGCYTSPHLVRYKERVRIRGRLVDDAELVAAFERVEAARGATSLTYFEFGTLAAVALFLEADVDVMVLEVGLGGRMDAVNVFDADVAVITSVDLDHMEYLGPTRSHIGREKAGIFRAGRPAVCGDRDPPAAVVEHAAAISAPLYVRGRDFDFRVEADHWHYSGPFGTSCDLPHPFLPGEHQYANASTAVAALEALGPRLFLTKAHLAEGIASARLPGRFQKLPRSFWHPPLILDVAHNPEAARALAAALRCEPWTGRTLAVCGMLRDKDHAGVIAPLRPLIDAWFVAELAGPRGGAGEAVVQVLEAAGAGTIARAPDVPQAFYAASKAAGPDDRILVFGSFHTVGEVLALLAGGQDGRDKPWPNAI